MFDIRKVLGVPLIYHWGRQLLTGGLPLGEWAHIAGLDDPKLRIADIGCGPCDMLRVVDPQSAPAFYLGIDVSDDYLGSAASRAESVGLDSRFITMNLYQLMDDPQVRQEFKEALETWQINRVIMYGVLHHIEDAAVECTLKLLHDVACVESVVTQDVVRIDGRWLNNKFCDWDRGTHVRTEAQYDDLLDRAAWPKRETLWTHAGYPFIKYIHYVLGR